MSEAKKTEKEEDEFNPCVRLRPKSVQKLKCVTEDTEIFTKDDLFEAYKQSALDGGWKDDDEELELFFEKWYQLKFGL